MNPPPNTPAGVPVLADGSHGVLSPQLREHFGGGRNPQVYSIGIKAVAQFPGDNPFGTNRLLPTLG